MSVSSPRYWIVVPAAGVGRRFGGTVPKQYQQLLGRSVAQWTLERLLAVESIDSCVVAIGADDGFWAEQDIDSPRLQVTCGGKERADTVRLALRTLERSVQPDDWVLVHDIARPCVSVADINDLIGTLADDPVGGILAAPIADTVKRVGRDRAIQGTEDRSQLWSALTPQMFRYSVLCKALDSAVERGEQPTDEASAVEALGLQPKVVPGQRDNIKITRREDLAIAEAILRSQEQSL